VDRLAYSLAGPETLRGRELATYDSVARAEQGLAGGRDAVAACSSVGGSRGDPVTWSQVVPAFEPPRGPPRGGGGGTRPQAWPPGGFSPGPRWPGGGPHPGGQAPPGPADLPPPPPAPRDLVVPRPVDPRGRQGPTRGQARGSQWRRCAPGLYVPAATATTVEQRVLEQSARLGTGAVTGWAALRWWGAAFFDGLAPDGRTPLPVPLLAGTDRLRPGAGVVVQRARVAPADVVLRGGVRVVGAQRALLDEPRRHAPPPRPAPAPLEPAAAAPVAAGAAFRPPEAAYDPALRLLERPDRPTALLCFPDAFAAQALRAAEALGLRVPEDLSVVGFDDGPRATSLPPALTTVAQDVTEKRRTAVAGLLQVMGTARGTDTPTGSAGASRTVMPTSLVVRGSTAPPPTDS